VAHALVRAVSALMPTLSVLVVVVS